MPYTRKTVRRKPRAKRAPRRYYRKKKTASSVIVKSPSAFPDKMFTKLNYVDMLDITTSTTSHQVYRGNDCFDPYYTGAGHQPMGFDEYMGIYKKFTVMASKIVITTMSQSGYPTSLTVRPVNDTTAPAYQYVAKERPRTRSISFNNYSGRHLLKHYMTSARQFGVDRKSVMSEDNYSGTSSASPANDWYWSCFAKADSGLSTQFYLWIKITYYVVFHERSQMSTS